MGAAGGGGPRSYKAMRRGRGLPSPGGPRLRAGRRLLRELARVMSIFVPPAQLSGVRRRCSSDVFKGVPVMDKQPLRILLVDDSRATQAAVRHVLGGQGHRLDVATTELEALIAIENEDYDAILMDIGMPQMDGLEATRRLCQSWPSSSRPPIIALTASTSPEMRERCFRVGMEDFLAKPVRGSVL